MSLGTSDINQPAQRIARGLTVELNIKITCLCVLYPLTPHFYIVKLGFKGVYIIFLFLL